MSAGDEKLTPEIRFNSNKRAEISWKPIVGFIIERKMEGGSWMEIGRVKGDQCNYLSTSDFDFFRGIKYECRVVAVYEDGSRGFGASKKLQVPSAPKIFVPLWKIPLRANFPTRLVAHCSGYPAPNMAWTDLNDQPFSNDIILSHAFGEHFISCLIIPPITDGIEWKYVKFMVENSEGKDEAIFELITEQGEEAANPIPIAESDENSQGRDETIFEPITEQGKEAANPISTAESEEPSKKVQNLQGKKLMGPYFEYVQLTWTTPNVPWTNFIVQRLETTTMKWKRISKGKTLKPEFLDCDATIGGHYQYRILTAIRDGEITASDVTAETFTILMKEKIENGIEVDSSGQKADSAGPSGQNTNVSTTKKTVRAKKRPAKKSGRPAKIVKTEVDDEEVINVD